MISEFEEGLFSLQGRRQAFKMIKVIGSIFVVKLGFQSLKFYNHHLKNTTFVPSILTSIGVAQIFSEMSVKRKEFEAMEAFSKTSFVQKSREISYVYSLDVLYNNSISLICDKRGSCYYDENHLTEVGASKLK
ncbi:hypothetical protein N9X12_00790 [Alphaproteobacteria bacterium]|nr:hypothetical protein [Alphaproteobacteria bacterium]